jgi:pyruvate dehydrogenase E1 component alpha subunit
MDKKALTGNAIVAAQWGIAAGAGFVAKRDGVVCVCTGGEGSTNRGPFHESLNMASALNLPILYVVEFNDSQMWNKWSEMAGDYRVAIRAVAYGMEGVTVDGNDPDAIFEQAYSFMEKIRMGGKPCLLECLTGKWTDSVNSARNQPEVLESYKQPDFDAILRYEIKLKALGILTDSLDAEIKARIQDKIAAGVEFGRNSEMPDIFDGVDQVYSQPVV